MLELLNKAYSFSHPSSSMACFQVKFRRVQSMVKQPVLRLRIPMSASNTASSHLCMPSKSYTCITSGGLTLLLSLACRSVCLLQLLPCQVMTPRPQSA